MEITRVILVDDIAGRRYEKTEDGTFCFVKRRSGKFYRRKRLERHKEADLNRLLLERAIIEKVETPTKPPASFNKLYNAARTYWTPLNLVVSKQDPEGIVIFHRRQPLGTISLKWLDRFIARLIRFRCEYALWKEAEKKEKLDEEV